MEKRKDLITEREWVKEFWDPERNGCDIRILEGLRPNTHKKFWFKCPDCGYRFPKTDLSERYFRSPTLSQLRRWKEQGSYPRKLSGCHSPSDSR